MRLLIVSLIFLVGYQIGWAKDDTGVRTATGSTQFELAWLTINQGGSAQQSSTNYGAGISCGQVVSGTSQSTNYRVTFGFWQLGVTATGVEEVPTPELPASFSLMQNYPNPFNPTTVIEFTVPQRCKVELVIYNLLGEKVTTLVSQDMPTGKYRVSWDGKNESGKEVASGVYFYKLKAGDFTATKKMVLLK